MDNIKKNDNICSFEVAKFFGIYQMFFPNNIKILGYNAYHIIVLTIISLMMILCILTSIDLRYLNNDITTVLYIGIIENMVFVAIKIIVIMYNSKKIWKLLNYSRFYLMKYKHYDVSLFKYWQKKSAQVTFIYLVMICIAWFIWVSIPLVFKRTKMSIKMHDGSCKVLPLNVFNFNFMVSEEFYNGHFYQFFFMEIICGTFYASFNGLFDMLIIIICIAFIGQLDLICKAVETLGNNFSILNSSK